MPSSAEATATKADVRPGMAVPLVQEPSRGEGGARLVRSEKRQFRHWGGKSCKDEGDRRHWAWTSTSDGSRGDRFHNEGKCEWRRVPKRLRASRLEQFPAFRPADGRFGGISRWRSGRICERFQTAFFCGWQGKDWHRVRWCLPSGHGMAQRPSSWTPHVRLYRLFFQPYTLFIYKRKQ